MNPEPFLRALCGLRGEAFVRVGAQPRCYGISELMSPVPFGLPHRVTRSQPGPAEYVPLLPLVISWKAVEWLEPSPIV
jgi:hypothetical protein